MTGKENFLHIRLKNLIEGLSSSRLINSQESVLKVYDKNLSSIFEDSEITQIKSDFKLGVFDELLKFENKALEDEASFSAQIENLENVNKPIIDLVRKCKLKGYVLDSDKYDKASKLLKEYPKLELSLVQDFMNLELSFDELKTRAEKIYQQYSDSMQDRIACEIEKEKLFSSKNAPKIDVPQNEIVKIAPYKRGDCITIVQVTKDNVRNEYDLEFSGELIEAKRATNIVRKFDEKTGIEHIIKLHPSKAYSLGDLQVIEEVTRQYNKKGNIIEEVRLTPSCSVNNFNISITDKKGKMIPVQWASYDEKTGTTNVQKDFISPSGTKTQYYMEENDDFKLMEYKIVNKFGKVLMDRKQTIQKVSENEYITSLNNDVYKTVFNENSIVITQTKTGKTKTIDLNNLIKKKSDKDFYMNILKQVPANLLVHIDEFLQLEHNYKDENACANSKMINFGSFGDFYAESLPGIFMHEFGHYLGRKYVDDDSTIKNTAVTLEDDDEISSNQQSVDIMVISNIENYDDVYKDMSELQKQYFCHYEEHKEELLGDATCLLNYGTIQFLNARMTNLQWSMADDVAKCAKLIDSIEINWDE